MDRIRALLRSALFDFGGMIVFYALLATLGLRAAIVGTLLFVPLDAWRRHALGIGFPRLYLLTTAIVLVFGAIDVSARRPFMLRYEGAVTEGIIGIAFWIGARGRSIIEELVLQQQPDLAIPNQRRHFQLITRSWSLYFLCMACLYVWIGRNFSLVHAVEIRQVASIAGAMSMALFSFSGRFAAGLFERLGLMPKPA